MERAQRKAEEKEVALQGAHSRTPIDHEASRLPAPAMKYLPELALGTRREYKLTRTTAGQPLGVAITTDGEESSGGRAVIYAVRPNSIAHEVGVPPDTYLTSIDGVSTEGFSLEEVQRTISNAVQEKEYVVLEVEMPADPDALLQAIYEEQDAQPSPPPSPPEPLSVVARAKSVVRIPRRASLSLKIPKQKRLDERKMEELREQALEINRMRLRGECNSSQAAKDLVEMRKLEAQVDREKRRQKRGKIKTFAKGEEVAAAVVESAKKRRLSLVPRPKPSTNIAAIAIETRLRQKRKDLRWRGPYERGCRLVLAWTFNLLVPGIAYLVAIIIAAKLGEAETYKMCIGWLVAYGATFAIVEPAQVVILASAPCLFDEETKIGRCCSRVRFVYNELFAP